MEYSVEPCDPIRPPLSVCMYVCLYICIYVKFEFIELLTQLKITRRTTGAKGNYFLQVFTIFYKYHRASILERVS